jgi:hypothetical protein
MPFFYDLNHNSTTNATANTASQVIWAKTIANQETLGLYGLFAGAKSGTAGGGLLRLAVSTSSTGGMASGGTAVTPFDKNFRSPAAQSVWANDVSAITGSTGPTSRLSVGFAQTGGMGGYVPLVPTAAIQMIANSTVTFNPTDWEFTSIAFSSTVNYDYTIDIGEGI